MPAAARKSNCGAIVNRSSDIAAIEARRRQIGATQLELVAAAGIGSRTYDYLLAGHTAPQPRTLNRLWRALERLAGARPAAPAPDLIAACYRQQVAIFAVMKGRDPQATLTDQAKAAGNIRAMAIYVTAVELEITDNATLARAIGCSRQNVKQVRDSVEDRRDDPEVDRLLNLAAAIARQP